MDSMFGKTEFNDLPVFSSFVSDEVGFASIQTGSGKFYCAPNDIIFLDEIHLLNSVFIEESRHW